MTCACASPQEGRERRASHARVLAWQSGGLTRPVRHHVPTSSGAQEVPRLPRQGHALAVGWLARETGAPQVPRVPRRIHILAIGCSGQWLAHAHPLKSAKRPCLPRQSAVLAVAWAGQRAARHPVRILSRTHEVPRLQRQRRPGSRMDWPETALRSAGGATSAMSETRPAIGSCGQKGSGPLWTKGCYARTPLWRRDVLAAKWVDRGASWHPARVPIQDS
jgi:hypothetical protein